jgi:hypothetical protein
MSRSKDIEKAKPSIKDKGKDQEKVNSLPPTLPTAKAMAPHYEEWREFADELEGRLTEAKGLQGMEWVKSHPEYDSAGPTKDAEKELKLGRPLKQWEITNAKLFALQYCRDTFMGVEDHESAKRSIQRFLDEDESYVDLERMGTSMQDTMNNAIAVCALSYGLKRQT